MYKMVVFDVDGTLLPFQDDELAPEIKDLFRRLKANNLVVALATGRDFVSIGDLHLDENLDYFIGANGSFVYDLKKQEYLFNSAIKFSDYENYYKDILLTHQNTVYNVILSDDEHVFVWDHKKMDGHWFWEPFKEKFRDFDKAKEQINHDKFHLITINCTNNSDIIEDSKTYFKNNHSSLSVQAWWPNGLFVANRHMSKAHAIELVCQHLNFSIEQVVAFGDSENDLSMLKTVGLGVAMGNGNEHVKAIADDITTNVEEFGTITYLEKLGLI